MPGIVEVAMRNAVRPGMILHTPTHRKPFEVERLDSRGISLLLGKDRTRSVIPWQCLEGIPPYVHQKGGRVEIGGQYKVGARPGTLDAYLKAWVNRATAGWVAVVLETAGVLEITSDRPAQVRLLSGF